MKAIFLVAICLATSAPAQSLRYSGSDGNPYREEINENGTVLINGNGEKLYLGKDCDAYSPSFGNGFWRWANGGFVVSVGHERIAFGRQEIIVDYPKCRD